MQNLKRRFTCFGSLPLLLAGLLGLAQTSQAADWSGFVAGEFRYFTYSPLDDRQHDSYLSLAAEVEYYREWNNGRDSLTFTPFVRFDQHDGERGHADIRELAWVHVARDWELRAGIRKVFWGVTESQHLVDIINQTDLVENPDQEDKLGQPMVNLALIRDWGTLDLFILPGFRERTFPGAEGRLRTPLVVDADRARYESPAKDRRIDVAVRWSRTLGDWDVGLYHFSGTSREPRLLPGVDQRGAPVLTPYYDVIEQTGLDVQATKGAWLWKLEAIHRRGQGEPFSALVGGFEYTFYGVFDSARDVGWLLEYHYDDRGDAATSPFQNDLMSGLRLALNDPQSSELLAGAILDLDRGGVFYVVEASRRLGQHWKLGLEGRAFAGLHQDDPSFSLRRDDYLQLELAYYF
jgi:hypothetical protein